MQWMFTLQTTEGADVLTRILAVFRRQTSRVHAINSSPAAEGMRVTVLADADAHRVKRIQAQLKKLYEVDEAEAAAFDNASHRRMGLFEVRCTTATRSHLFQLAAAFHARMLSVSGGSLTIEMTGGSEEVEALGEILQPYGVLDASVTGPVRVSRKAGNATAKPLGWETITGALADHARAIDTQERNGTYGTDLL